MGSKAKYADHLIPLILDRFQNEKPLFWVEPFVGGANSIAKVPPILKRIGSDANPHLIALFHALQDGWIPPDAISESEYASLKRHAKASSVRSDSHLIAFAGFGSSFGRKWFGGYARGLSASGEPRNYALETKKNLLAQLPNIQTVEFRHAEYRDLVIPAESVVYLDPPYAGTTKYRNSFDSAGFWDWASSHDLKKRFFVSEYHAPGNWTEIWRQETGTNLGPKKKPAVERLFAAVD